MVIEVKLEGEKLSIWYNRSKNSMDKDTTGVRLETAIAVTIEQKVK